MPEAIMLSSWVKESNRRGEEIDTYMVNNKTNEVVWVGINPNFVAGIMKVGEITNYKLVPAKS